MRILVAAERLGHGGGMERYLDIVLPALIARGATVHVLARELDSVPAGATAQRIAWADEHDEPTGPAHAQARRAVAEFGADVAVAHNVMDAGIVAELRAAPRFAYHLHDHRPCCPNGDRVFPRSGRNCTRALGAACIVHAVTDGCAYGPKPRTLTLIRRREGLRDAIAAADAVIAASRYVADRAAQNRISRERIVEIPLPLADDAFVEAAAPAPAGSIVFAGRVVPQKGLTSLIRAVARIAADARPLVRAFGDGSALAPARDAAAAAGVMLDAPGRVPVETLRAAIDAAAFAVLPSLWAEPFGYAGIEALARGRAVIAYDVGGVRAWLDDGVNGVAVPAGDERALSGAIAALLEDRSRRERLGTRARQDAERFRTAPIVEALLSAYRPG
jgi:glycosyltransferase involved in cell wall biosynthesis